ncbi:MAG: glycoside hydrolase family 9 protein [Candidatus Brocadiae bacterium]|nr:glycoside hydrolase family 9 protein [Candidatus Brocadiia bacterium]
MVRARHVCLVVIGSFLLSVLPPGALGAERRWTPAEVEEATRLNDIVFFKERTTRETTRGAQRWYLWSNAVSGEVDGLSSAATSLPSSEAAKDDKLGLRLDLNIRGENPVWHIQIAAEITPPIGSIARTKNLFDAYAYRPRGALEFDLRGAARGKGLAVAFYMPSRRSEMPQWTPLDPYLSDATDWQHVAVPVAAMDLSNPKSNLHVASRLLIGGRGYAGKLQVDLDNIVLHSDGPEPERGPVRLNHVGYLPAARKVAFVAGSRLLNLDGRPFMVRAVGRTTDEPVFRGALKLRAAFEPEVYGEWVYEADFSALQGPGRYVLEVPGVGRSVGFYVHEAVYDYLYYHMARMFMYQRSGDCALPEKNAFEWARGPCYTDPTPFQSDPTKTRRILHGWIDAGDARVYPHGFATGRLMQGWEMTQASHFDGQLNLPESGNGIPDFLDELRWKVTYFREMQLDSGACIGYVMPSTRSGSNPDLGRDKGWDSDPDPRLILDKRLTYDRSVRLGSCMAAMARMIEPYDPQDAAAFAAAALRAWTWAEGNAPRTEAGRQPGWQDDIFWFAVEMWRLTGDERFHKVVRNFAGTEGRWDSNAWKNDSAPLAWVSYALDPRADPAIRSDFIRRFAGQLDVLFDLSSRDPYAVAVYPHGWYHAPSRIGHTAALLLTAWKLTGQDRYRDLAQEYVHYICGRNIYRLCDISNVAEETFSTPFNMYEWIPGRTAWMPGYVAYMSVDQGGNLSRFVARRVRVTRWNWFFGEPAIGMNHGMVIASMMLMEGKRYDDLIHQGAFPGVKPVRPGLPFPATPVEGPWGAEPVIPGPGHD